MAAATFTPGRSRFPPFANLLQEQEGNDDSSCDDGESQQQPQHSPALGRLPSSSNSRFLIRGSQQPQHSSKKRGRHPDDVVPHLRIHHHTPTTTTTTHRVVEKSPELFSPDQETFISPDHHHRSTLRQRGHYGDRDQYSVDPWRMNETEDNAPPQSQQQVVRDDETGKRSTHPLLEGRSHSNSHSCASTGNTTNEMHLEGSAPSGNKMEPGETENMYKFGQRTEANNGKTGTEAEVVKRGDSSAHANHDSSHKGEEQGKTASPKLASGTRETREGDAHARSSTTDATVLTTKDGWAIHPLVLEQLHFLEHQGDTRALRPPPSQAEAISNLLTYRPRPMIDPKVYTLSVTDDNNHNKKIGTLYNTASGYLGRRRSPLFHQQDENIAPTTNTNGLKEELSTRICNKVDGIDSSTVDNSMLAVVKGGNNTNSIVSSLSCTSSSGDGERNEAGGNRVSRLKLRLKGGKHNNHNKSNVMNLPASERDSSGEVVVHNDNDNSARLGPLSSPFHHGTTTDGVTTVAASAIMVSESPYSVQISEDVNDHPAFLPQDSIHLGTPALETIPVLLLDSSSHSRQDDDDPQCSPRRKEVRSNDLNHMGTIYQVNEGSDNNSMQDSDGSSDDDDEQDSSDDDEEVQLWAKKMFGLEGLPPSPTRKVSHPHVEKKKSGATQLTLRLKLGGALKLEREKSKRMDDSLTSKRRLQNFPAGFSSTDSSDDDDDDSDSSTSTSGSSDSESSSSDEDDDSSTSSSSSSEEDEPILNKKSKHMPVTKRRAKDVTNVVRKKQKRGIVPRKRMKQGQRAVSKNSRPVAKAKVVSAKMLAEQEREKKREEERLAEEKRVKDSAKPPTVAELNAIFASDNDLHGCGASSNWVRRSCRLPSRSILDSSHVRGLIDKLRNNDSDMVVLKLKKYLSDPDTPTVIIDAALDALEENRNCEALYIQNFNKGMRDEQILHLLRILQNQNCRIWCLNVGETYNVQTETWEIFAKGLEKTKVTHMYASEHTISSDTKDIIRETIRNNRTKHDLHINPDNLDVIIQCTHNWWNPANAKILAPYIKKRGYESLLRDMERQGLPGSTSAAPSGKESS